jgi:colanic acid biosynthesis glycosyl transferase WcaI
MRRLEDRDDVLFLFIGGGHLMPAIQAKVKRLGLTNARFLDYVPRDELAYSLSAASVSVVTEDPRVVGQLVPSKTYGILASGRPIVFVGSETSDVALIVRDAGCGEVVDPKDAERLTSVFNRLRDCPGECLALGARARQAAETRYNRRASTDAWSAELRRLADERM